MSLDLDGQALEVAIGLAFVFFLLSVIVSAGTEVVAWGLKWRARTLVKGIEGLLGGDEVAEGCCDQPAGPKRRHHPASRSARPSYVSPRNFARAMIQTVDRKGRGKPGPGTSAR